MYSLTLSCSSYFLSLVNNDFTVDEVCISDIVTALQFTLICLVCLFLLCCDYWWQVFVDLKVIVMIFSEL